MTIHSELAEPAKLAGAVVEAMRQEYEGLEEQAVDETVMGCELTGHDLAFYYLDLTNTAQVRSLRIGHSAYTIYCQAEDREFEQVKRVFQAMTTALLSGLSEPND